MTKYPYTPMRDLAGETGKYRVEFSATYEVEAENEDEAYEKAYALFNPADLYAYIDDEPYT